MEGREKTRIMHVAQAAGGVDRYLKMLLKYLDNDTYENIMVCSYDYVRSDYNKLTSYFHHVDMGRAISPKSDMKAILEVRKLIKQEQPDIIYAHSSKAGAIARIANIGLHTHCVYNPHGWAFNMKCKKIKQFVYASIERLLAHFCDTIICISDAEKMSAKRQHICRDKKLQVIFNGVDIERYLKSLKKERTVTRESLGIPEHAFVVGASGRLTAQKAPDVFIRAARMIKDRIPEAYFLMVGDGELKEEIWAYAEKYGLSDSLTITGWVKEPLEYVNLFDVAMLLSRWEGFGLALPEYMMADKPIVASNVDAIPNIIKNNVNGVLVEPDRPEDVFDAIMKIYADKIFAENLVQNGNVIVKQRFDAKRAAKEHEKMFSQIIGNTVLNTEGAIKTIVS